WYLFRIPIRNPDRVVGGIQGFKTIRYVRMYLTGFENPVVLRMAKFQLVGSQWRKYQEALNETGFNELPEITTSDFTVSVVNIEENSASNANKVPYVVPPGLSRDRDNTTFLNRVDNEQSLQICVEELEDKDARAVFKNVNYDLINYGRLKMFLHAEAFQGDNVQDDEVNGFLRIGTDFTENYYEIEVPLKITPPGISGSGDDIAREVWPEENEIDISINELLGLKSERNRNDLATDVPYTQQTLDGRYNITVKGRPDISSIQVMMIGIRNPESIDRETKSVCIWANELRVTDFDSKKGWAANARLSAKLADLGTVTASTKYISTGFGTIQQRIAERTREESFQYDISANINVDKFLLPHKTGLKVPMFVSYEQRRITPQFDPLDPDVPLEASLERLPTQKEKDDYKRLVEDRSTRRSLNFTNVRKEPLKKDRQRQFFDISNFSFSYAYSDVVTSNVNTQTFLQKTESGGVSYNYTPPAVSITPFANAKAFQSPYLQLIKDINFSPLPSNLSFRADLNRRFTKTQLYNDNLTIDGIDPYYERLFTFNRTYNLRWNLFKNLSLDYSARANAVIDEPDGPDDPIQGDIDTKAERRFIWDQIANLGRMKNFNQTMAATYKLPFEKIPLTDWVSADYRISAGYTWTAGSLGQEDTLGNFFGHTIQNTRDQNITGKIDMSKLYNKVSFLKKANAPPPRRNPRRRPPPKSKEETKEEDKDKKEKSKSSGKFVNGFLRMLMALRSVNVTYNIREGTKLSGFTPDIYLFGMDSSFNSPGWGFILGSQDPEIRFRAADNGWLTESPFLTAPFSQNFGTDLTIRATLEPFRDLKIQVDAKQSNTASFQEIYRFDTAATGGVRGRDSYRSLTPSRTGNYNISFLSINTAFENRPGNRSDAFNAFQENIGIIRDRLQQEVESQGIPYSYDSLSQDILIPAFIAAYSGQDPNNTKLSPFPKIPLPNWRVDYAGLTKLAGLGNVFTSINLTHGYRSTYSVGNYTNSLQYDDVELSNNILNYPLATIQDSTSQELVPVYIVNQVTISEQFAPLIGVNLRTKSNLTARVEYKKDRNLSLNLSNAQVTENLTENISLDFGFVKANFKMPWKSKGRVVALKNDLTFRVNMTYQDSRTIQRNLDGEIEVTNGNINILYRPTLAYKLNKKLDLTMYFERGITDPRVGSFRRATTAFGTQLRFNLAQ
ncbi:MAG: cell surface protein SprA, partial [Cyclobacteriaceae bacterium]|nr:cell surface protein SprA [Cyclobacteriaceae bacterium HetDA_MAG_MS6]